MEAASGSAVNMIAEWAKAGLTEEHNCDAGDLIDPKRAVAELDGVVSPSIRGDD